MSELHCLNPSLDTESPKWFHIFFLNLLQDILNFLHKLNPRNIETWRNLLGCDIYVSQVLLNQTKQLFNWVEPRTILSVEQNIHFELSTSCKNWRMSMNNCIVHQQNHRSTKVVPINSNRPKSLVNEVLKESRVNSTFNYLRWNHLILRNCCYQRNWVLLLLGCHLLHWKLHCFVTKLSQLLL